MEQRITISPRGILAVYAFPETPVFSLRLLVEDGPRRVFVTPHCQVTREQLEQFERAERWSMKGQSAPTLESGPIRIQVSELRGYGSQVVVFLKGKHLGMVKASEVMEFLRKIIKKNLPNPLHP